MNPTRPATLAGRTIVMSGGSRGIGLAIALRAARDGANVVLIAKTDTPHPKLRGTIHTAAEQIRAAGGRALPVVGDVRSDEAIQRAVRAAVDEFGGVDVCVNNASVLDLSPTARLAPRRYDLMQDVNARGTFMLTQACLPELVRSPDPHVLTLSPPLNLDPRWLGAYPGYMLAKYGMTLATLGFAAEYADVPVGANCLWPRTTIATDAVANLLGGDEALARTRTPQIMADAAHVILTTPASELSGQTLIDEDVLRGAGVTDLDDYATVPGSRDLEPDFFL
ncbi:SDR family oxidoreductase [Phytohabitans kaempferiae]|uniref:SDR family oxidoreductase n=1 Tax=Phytohabitans kaempferiae TaxID=1620943 RepID=A0ABV6M5J4_9ACTN